MDDLFLACRFLGYGADTQVLRTDDLVLVHILLNNAQELVAVTFGFRYTHTRNRQQLFHRDRVGRCHRFQTRVLENDKRRHIALLRLFATDVFQYGEQHFVRCCTGRTCTFHDLVFFVVYLYRHFEFARAADKFLTLFGQLQIAVRIYIFLDHSYQQCLPQDGMQRALVFVAGGAEIL